MFRIIIILFLSTYHLFTDVISTNGTINFDTNKDGSAEMVLNSLGNLQINGNVIANQIFVGANNGQSKLNINGSVGFRLELISTDTTLSDNTLVFVDTSNSNILLTLPSASTATGRLYKMKKTSLLNQLWINSSDNIDDFDQRLLITEDNLDLSYLELISNGTGWFVFNKSNDSYRVIAGDNLVGWWKFDEVSGAVAADSSLNSFSGSLGSGVTFSVNGTQGIIDQALSFNGSDDNDYVDLGSTVGSTPSLSVCFWAKASKVANMMPVSKIPNDASGIGWGLKYRSNGDIWWRVGSEGNNNSVAVTGASTYSIGTWHFVVCTFNNNTRIAKIYYDGTLRSQATAVTQNVNESSLTTRIAKSAGATSSEEFGGVIDDVRLYDRELSSVEIAAIHNQAN